MLEHCDLQQIRLCKGRDGMKRGTFYLKFYYKKNIFKELQPEALKIEFEEIISKKKRPQSSYYETDDDRF